MTYCLHISLRLLTTITINNNTITTNTTTTNTTTQSHQTTTTSMQGKRDAEDVARLKKLLADAEAAKVLLEQRLKSTDAGNMPKQPTI